VKEFMKTPYEFIHGHDWSRSGKIINWSLKLPNWPFTIIEGSKLKY